MKIDENKISYLESIEIVEKKDENKLFYKDSCYKAYCLIGIPS